MSFIHGLPVDLVLVRHGESEGNLYNGLPARGRRERLVGRHTSKYRLTDLGRNQAVRAGKILREHVGRFDRMFCSEYIRAVETAGHMDMPHSSFSTELLIREMDSGYLKGFQNPNPELRRHEKVQHALAPFWVRKGGGGESYADLSLRLRTFLEFLCSTASGLRVLVVCHGHVIRGFRSLLEDLKTADHDRLLSWSVPNCHIRWYSRRGDANRVHSKPHQVVSIDMEEPANIDRQDTAAIVEQHVIQRRFLDAADLRDMAQRIPQLINNADCVVDDDTIVSAVSPMGASRSRL